MNILVKICLIFIIIISNTPKIYTSNILVLAPFFGKSHAIFINSIVNELANRKHDITIITSNPIKNAPNNIRQIITVDKVHAMMDPASVFDMQNMNVALTLPFIWGILLESTDMYMSEPSVQDFINEKNNTFDLVISELFYQDAFYMFAHKYKTPLVLLDSSTYLTIIDDMMGHDSALSYVRNEFSKDFGEMTFLQRLENHFIGNMIKLGHRFYLRRKHHEIATKHFSKFPQPLPNIEDLEKNISLVLLNTHYSYDTPRPLVPGVIEIGGVHIKPPKPLPKDIQNFLDEAKEGAIYFSLGSNLQSASMPELTKTMFFNAFRKLKIRVLWKFEDELPKDLPNVKADKWLPQTDILAHPNVRLFISHGGMLGTQEAIHRGVPVLGLSVYGDQHQNMAKLATKKMSIHIPFAELTEEKIEKAINTIFTDPSYYENAKLTSERYHDQQNTPMEKAMFWIEYVIRHKGAPFMKSKMVDLPWYQYYFLDVYLFYIILDILVLFVLSKFLKIFCKIFSSILTKYIIAILFLICAISVSYYNGYLQVTNKV